MCHLRKRMGRLFVVGWTAVVIPPASGTAVACIAAVLVVKLMPASTPEVACILLFCSQLSVAHFLCASRTATCLSFSNFLRCAVFHVRCL
jgi:hypothetical protein